MATKKPSHGKIKTIKKVLAKYLYCKILYTDGPNMGKFAELTPSVLADEPLDNYALILRHFTKMTKEEKIALAALTATPDYCVESTIRPAENERDYFTVMYNPPAKSFHDHVKLVVKLTPKKEISLVCEVYDFSGKDLGHTLAKKIPVRNLMAVREYLETIGIVIPFGMLNNKTLYDWQLCFFEGSKELAEELKDIADELKANPLATTGLEAEEHEDEDDDQPGEEEEIEHDGQQSSAEGNNELSASTNSQVLPPSPD